MADYLSLPRGWMAIASPYTPRENYDEQCPSLQAIVVDTAGGLHAVVSDSAGRASHVALETTFLDYLQQLAADFAAGCVAVSQRGTIVETTPRTSNGDQWELAAERMLTYLQEQRQIEIGNRKQLTSALADELAGLVDCDAADALGSLDAFFTGSAAVEEFFAGPSELAAALVAATAIAESPAPRPQIEMPQRKQPPQALAKLARRRWRPLSEGNPTKTFWGETCDSSLPCATCDRPMPLALQLDLSELPADANWHKRGYLQVLRCHGLQTRWSLNSEYMARGVDGWRDDGIEYPYLVECPGEARPVFWEDSEYAEWLDPAEVAGSGGTVLFGCPYWGQHDQEPIQDPHCAVCQMPLRVVLQTYRDEGILRLFQCAQHVDSHAVYFER